MDPHHPNCGWMLTASHALLCRPLGINIMNTCQTHPGTSWRRSIGAGPQLQGEVLSFVIGCKKCTYHLLLGWGRWQRRYEHIAHIIGCWVGDGCGSEHRKTTSTTIQNGKRQVSGIHPCLKASGVYPPSLGEWIINCWMMQTNPPTYERVDPYVQERVGPSPLARQRPQVTPATGAPGPLSWKRPALDAPGLCPAQSWKRPRL